MIGEGFFRGYDRIVLNVTRQMVVLSVLPCSRGCYIPRLSCSTFSCDEFSTPSVCVRDTPCLSRLPCIRGTAPPAATVCISKNSLIAATCPTHRPTVCYSRQSGKYNLDFNEAHHSRIRENSSHEHFQHGNTAVSRNLSYKIVSNNKEG